MTVVFDTNVIISAIFFGGVSRRCLLLWAGKRFQMAVTREILDEYSATAERMTRQTGIRSAGHLEWIHAKAKYFEPSPLGKRRSRDSTDDKFLACALAAQATVIVTGDKDLLSLGKPFGIEIVEPRQFVERFPAND